MRVGAVLLRVHLEDDFFSDFSFTNALLLSEKQSRQAAPEDREKPDMEKCVDIMDSAITSVVDDLCKHGDPGAVLCFLPGWSEIRQMEERLAQSSKIWAVPLHSTLPKEKQQHVFRSHGSGLGRHAR